MGQELLYTSAPKGLKSGSRGFCTVVCTQGMPQPLVTALESLSGYRHVFPAGDRNAAKNPIAWSHLKMTVAGRAYHVLSRIADYGLDYSQRGNKLAHHVALDAAELAACGPASLLEQPGNMDAGWDGQPRLLPAGRTMQGVSPPPSIGTAWQSLAGDAGWAGVVAESFLAAPDRQVYITFAPGMDLLPLMTEAMSLLPPERRWEVTFCTYFTSLPPGVTCAWRGVLSGSPEAEQARKFTKAMHIDLCQTLPPASGGSLVAAARTGPSIEARSSLELAPVRAADDGSADEELGLRPTGDDLAATESDPAGMHFAEYVPAQTAEPGYGVARPPGMPPPPPPAMPGKKRRTLADLNEADAVRRSKLRWVFGSLAMVLISSGVALWKAPGPFKLLRVQIGWQSEPTLDVADKNADAELADRAENRAKKHTDANDGEAPDNGIKRISNAKNGGGATESASVELAQKKSPTDPAPERENPSAAKQGDPDGHTEPREENVEKVGEPQPSKPAAEETKSAEKVTARVPSYDGQPLVRAEFENYERYQFDLADEKLLDVPINRKDVTWDLHVPIGINGFGVGTMRGSKRELLGPGPTAVPASKPVLSVEESFDGEWLHLKLKKTNDEHWPVIRWCVLSVSEPNMPPRLFALQSLERRPDPLAFAVLFWRQPLPNSTSLMPPVSVKSVTIKLQTAARSFEFQWPDQETKTGSSLELDEYAMPILSFGVSGNSARKTPFVPMEFSIQQSTRPVGSMAQMQIKWEQTQKSSTSDAKRRISDFSGRLLLNSQLETKIVNEIMKKADQTETLDSIIESIGSELEKLRKLLNGQVNQLAVTDAEERLKSVKVFREQVKSYLQFKADLSGAPVTDALFVYKFKNIPGVNATVQIPLRFSLSPN